MPDKLHKCDYEGCTSSFNTKYKVQKHKKSVHTKKSYECDYEGCKSVFKD